MRKVSVEAVVMRRHGRSRLAALLLLGVCLVPAPVANAGEYHVYSCRTPAGAVAPIYGWTGSTTGPWMYDTKNCESGGSLTAALGGNVSQPANTSLATWTFSAPAGTSIAAAKLWRADSAVSWEAGNNSTQTWLAAPENDESSAFDRCVRYTGCTGIGNPSVPMSAENLVEAPGDNVSGATHIYMAAECGGSSGTSCPAVGGGYAVSISLYAADITLADDTPPKASNVGGSLATSQTLSGVGDVSFSATDTGSGLYEAVFLIDGKAVSSQLLGSDDESCRNVGGTSAGTHAFLSPQPCPLELEGDDLSFNTALAPEGSHLLTVQLLDAAGNATTILSHQVTIDNKPAGVSPTTPTGSSGPGSSTGSSPGSVLDSALVQIGPGSPAAERGPANGTNASDEATLSAHWTRTRKVTFTSRYGARDQITGRLTSASGQAISGAMLDVFQTPASQGAKTIQLAGVRTGPTGAWSLTLPQGVSSSMLRFAYRSHVDDTVAVATATLTLRVYAGIALRIAPRVASVGRSIHFSGVLAGGPVPPGGKQLVLEASSGGEWIQFDTVSTNAKGRYRASYRFKFPGPVTYRFRVVSRYEADFPFLGGASNVVRVHER